MLPPEAMPSSTTSAPGPCVARGARVRAGGSHIDLPYRPSCPNHSHVPISQRSPPCSADGRSISSTCASWVTSCVEGLVEVGEEVDAGFAERAVVEHRVGGARGGARRLQLVGGDRSDPARVVAGGGEHGLRRTRASETAPWLVTCQVPASRSRANRQSIRARSAATVGWPRWSDDERAASRARPPGAGSSSPCSPPYRPHDPRRAHDGAVGVRPRARPRASSGRRPTAGWSRRVRRTARAWCRRRRSRSRSRRRRRRPRARPR